MIRHKKVSAAEAPIDSTKVGGPDWNEDHFPAPGFPVQVAIFSARWDEANGEFSTYFGSYNPVMGLNASFIDPGTGGATMYFDLPPPPNDYAWRFLGSLTATPSTANANRTDQLRGGFDIGHDHDNTYFCQFSVERVTGYDMWVVAQVFAALQAA